MAGRERENLKSGFRFLDFFIIVFFLSVTAVCLYLFRLDLLNTFSLQNVEPVGTVIIKKNTVQRRLNDRILWDTLANESPVYVGDIIRVAEVSSAMLNIQDNSIDLDENTLIRISLSPDGESLQISVNSGTLVLHAGEGSKNIVVNIDGRNIRPEKGTVLRAGKPEEGQASIEVYESAEQFVKEVPLRQIPQPRLLSPAADSIIRYQSDNPVLNFRWTKVDEVSSYFLQVSSSQSFRNLRINKKTSSASVSLNDLGQGLWYWRVMPDLPAIYSPVYSNVLSFNIEQTAEKEPDQNISIAQWLEDEMPGIKPPPVETPEIPAPVPPAPAPARPAPAPVRPAPAPVRPAPVPVRPAPVPARPAPARPAPAPVALLPVPQNLQPAQGTTYGFTQLQSQRSIEFRWSAVQDANAYIFTLYQQNPNGRRQIIRETLNNSTRYTLDNLSLLDRGTFIWNVEAVRMGRGGDIERHGIIADNSFIIDFPSPSSVQIEDTGILYGN
jgi:hypothetical protein